MTNYVPDQAFFDVQNPEELYNYLRDELDKIAEVLGRLEVPSIALVELHDEPAYLFEGMVVFADGTDWNPGSGKGVYARHGGVWNLLG